jgi:hypothetical protein
MTDSLFPLDRAESYLRPDRAGLERDGNCLRWPDRDGVTELQVVPVAHRTLDGRLVSELVTLTHTSPALSSLDARTAMLWNQWATLSALVPAYDEQPTRLVCKVGVFSTDRALAEHIYAPLVCTEATIIGFHAACLAREIFAGNPDDSPLMETHDPPPFEFADFEATKAITDRHAYSGSLAYDGLAVEFPWDPGAISQLFGHDDYREAARKFRGHTSAEMDRMGGRTSLFRLTNSVNHALYGKGVMSRLEIPLPIDGPDVATLIDELNRWELSSAHLAPQFGAWCKGPRAPIFISFLPTQFCFPGLLQHLTVWAHVRHVRVHKWLTASPTRK